MLRQVAIVGILAIGQTFVILTAGIDLSVGSILGLVGGAVRWAAGEPQPGGGDAARACSPASLAGIVNGIGVAYARIPAFIMTLGMLSFARGLAFIYTGGTPIPIINENFYYRRQRLHARHPDPVPDPDRDADRQRHRAAHDAVRALRLRHRLQRGRRAALRRAGAALQDLCLRHLGLSARRLAGLVYSSQLGVGTPIAGQGYELDAIAAVVVGGTSLFGGKGSVFGTFIGTLIIGMLANILNLTGVDPFVQQLFKGALIVIAVFIMSRSSRSLSDARTMPSFDRLMRQASRRCGRWSRRMSPPSACGAT